MEWSLSAAFKQKHQHQQLQAAKKHNTHASLTRSTTTYTQIEKQQDTHKKGLKH